jgi:hypothetical protein
MEDARAALLRVKIEGGESSFSVKNYQLSRRSARQRLLLEASKLDMLIVPEGGFNFGNYHPCQRLTKLVA